MSLALESIAFGVFVSSLAAGACGWRDHVRFLERLRKQHAAAWQDLNCPVPHNTDGDQPGDWSVFFFILLGRYVDLPDPQLHALGHRIRLTLALSIAGVVALAYLLVVNDTPSPLH